MHLVQIFLPITGPGGARILPSVREKLTSSFGGVTIYARSPARGSWVDREDGHRDEDDVVVVEVMVDQLDRGWWASYRSDLERLLGQEEILMRTITCERI